MTGLDMQLGRIVVARIGGTATLRNPTGNGFQGQKLAKRNIFGRRFSRLGCEADETTTPTVAGQQQMQPKPVNGNLVHWSQPQGIIPQLIMRGYIDD